jgi:16S rRNA (cytidine1402-2'-O)-methyltransferase
VSDAGTPSVSDPGVEVVRAAIEAGIDVVAVAGPSAVAAAVSIAGARGDGFRFIGFLPRGEAAIEQVLVRHAADVLVAFESPNRLAATLGVLARTQPERTMAACRELTKLHEQVARGTASDLLETFAGGVRGELVLVLDPIDGAPDAATVDALALARDMVEAGVRSKDATRIAARHAGGRARELYDLLLAERDV